MEAVFFHFYLYRSLVDRDVSQDCFNSRFSVLVAVSVALFLLNINKKATQGIYKGRMANSRNKLNLKVYELFCGEYRGADGIRVHILISLGWLIYVQKSFSEHIFFLISEILWKLLGIVRKLLGMARPACKYFSIKVPTF